MEQLVLRRACWLSGSKQEVLERLQRWQQIYGNISVAYLLELLQQ